MSTPTQLVPFAQRSMAPANLANVFGGLVAADDLTHGAEASFPILSIKGKVWRVSHGGNQIILQREGHPLPYLDVVVVKANKNLSKLYYSKAYAEGDDASPDCSSANGITPDVGVLSKQADQCSTCPHNVWGSKITPQGTKTKACADLRRVALLPEKDLECKAWAAPLLLRIPAASLQALSKYAAEQLGGQPYAAVVTRIGFDMEAAYPKLTFQPVRWLEANELEIVAKWLRDPIVERIIGTEAQPVVGATPVTMPVTEQPITFVPRANVPSRGEGLAAEVTAGYAARAVAAADAAQAFAMRQAVELAPPAATVTMQVAKQQVVETAAAVNHPKPDHVPPALWGAVMTVGGPDSAAGKAILATVPAPVVVEKPWHDGLPAHIKAAVEAVGGPDSEVGKTILGAAGSQATAGFDDNGYIKAKMDHQRKLATEAKPKQPRKPRAPKVEVLAQPTVPVADLESWADLGSTSAAPAPAAVQPVQPREVPQFGSAEALVQGVDALLAGLNLDTVDLDD